MPRAEQPKLADTNMAGYGGKEHKELKKEVAKLEPAWKEAGKKVGVQIWRVEKFEIKDWEKKAYGSFYNGDAYIVLDTYHPLDDKGKPTDKLAFDLHFWLGKFSTQDERGTAAYKTVELDDYLSDLPVQYRQTQGHESKEFLALFGTIQIMEGGIESGFNHVKPTEYKHKLLHIHGINAKFIKVEEVAMERKSLNMGDVFVLDAGLDLYQWNGTSANVWEKRKAEEVIKKIQADRNGKPKVVVLDGNESNDKFWTPLGGKGDIAPAKEVKKVETKGAGAGKGPVMDKAGVEAEAPKTEDENWHPDCIKELYRIDAAGAAVKFTPVARGGEKILKKDLDTKHSYVLDVDDQDHEHHVYVWVGKGAGKEAQKTALKWGGDFIASFKLDEASNVVRVVEGSNVRDIGFNKAFDG